MFPRYRHFKGALVEVLGTASHSETLEDYVVYRHVAGDTRLWVRPKVMFFETVTVDGRSTPRFSPIEQKSPQNVEDAPGVRTKQ